MLVSTAADPLQKIVVLNPKGGSGKTTLATNLAAAFALSGEVPTLIDCDRQGYCLRWLEKRPADRPRVHGISACDRIDDLTSGTRDAVWPESRKIIVDLPGSLEPDQIFDLTYDADRILIPIMPSAVDTHSAARFVAELLLNAQLDQRAKRLGVIASRIRRNTLSYRRLLRFLGSLRIPVVGELRDSQNFVAAAETGLGVCEMPTSRAGADATAVREIQSWLTQRPTIQTEPAIRGDRYRDVPGVSVLKPLRLSER